MKNMPIYVKILLKSICCGFAYLIFSALIFVFVYILDLFGITIFLGVFYGIAVAVISFCDTAKRTVIAMFAGLLSACIAQLMLTFTGIANKIILYHFRNDEFVREMGRLSLQHRLGYGWGTMLFWYGFIVTFAVSLIVALIIHAVRKRKIKTSIQP